jgi:hypothetical protein
MTSSTADGDKLVRVRVADRKLDEIKSLKDIREVEFYTNWGGLAPDDSPLTLRNAATQEIYAVDVDLP